MVNAAKITISGTLWKGKATTEIMCVHQLEHVKRKKKKITDSMELHLSHLPVSAKGTGQASGRLGNESTTPVLETQ